MPKVIITQVPGLDGEYDLDMTFTHRDFHTIKQVAGIRANEVQGALEAGDMDIIVAMAEIALRRAGKAHLVDQLWDAEAGAITLDVEDLEEDASPPPQEPEPRSDDEKASSGISTNGDTESSPEISTPEISGTPQPASTSDPLTSTT